MRKFFARILPETVMAYLLHLRPRAWVIVSAHMSIGFILSLGLTLSASEVKQWLLAVLAWGILGNGGTLALNSAFDRDEGDIGYLEDPPLVPPLLAVFALFLLVLGGVVASLVGDAFLIAYGVCSILSILYSVPPMRLKARGGWDILVNSVGYGGLTIYAGWAASGRGVFPPIMGVVAAFVSFFVGFYPLTQIYQMAEDSHRGDRTVALVLGKRGALCLACVGVTGGFVLLFAEMFRGYWSMLGLGLGIAVIGWAVVLIPWCLKWRTVSPNYEQRGFYLALYAWALTDIATAIAFMPHG